MEDRRRGRESSVAFYIEDGRTDDEGSSGDENEFLRNSSQVGLLGGRGQRSSGGRSPAYDPPIKDDERDHHGGGGWGIRLPSMMGAYANLTTGNL